MKTINQSINKTKYKVLFNNLLLNGNNYIKVKVFYKNGLSFKVYPIENTQLNKYLLRF
jgi:hypothetical protein